MYFIMQLLLNFNLSTLAENPAITLYNWTFEFIKVIVYKVMGD